MLTRRGLMLGLAGLPVAGVAAVSAQDGGGLIVVGSVTARKITATKDAAVVCNKADAVMPLPSEPIDASKLTCRSITVTRRHS